MIEQDFVCTDDFESNGIVKWNSPSNIALVKYWGKKENQIPQNPSISFTLSKCHTSTSIEFNSKKNKDNKIIFEFEDQKNHPFGQKIKLFISSIEKYFKFLPNHDINIKSKNNFPHSSGIASSASSMSALAACLVDFEYLNSDKKNKSYYINKKSFIARLGSGSASRSIEGPISLWGLTDSYKESSDLYSINISEDVNKVFHNYQNSILIIDPGVKKISSSIGHKLMNENPFSEKRFDIARNNISRLKDVFKSGNLDEFINLTESEALMIHSLMLSSNPYFILMKPNTLEVISRILEYRRETKLPVSFTLDAGSNVHLLYPFSIKQAVQKFIEDDLLIFCKSNACIHDYLGNGSEKVS
ncbi:MAG: diphosphomevalonate decarboxylase [Flavobacteriaceae bacterium]|nr:diphosphomevalonate decarboxylase [Flavobacteriaceae bacterium]